MSSIKYSYKLSDAIHVLAYVVIYQGGDLSSQTIAKSIETNPSMVRRLMSQLVKAGLLSSQPGKVAVKLAQAPEAISLLDVYRAVSDDANLLHVDPKTNPQCIVGGNIQGTLDNIYTDVQVHAEARLDAYTLADVIADIRDRSQGKTAAIQ